MPEPVHATLLEALYAIRQEVGPLVKDATADTGKYTYRYLALPTLIEKVEPVAWAHGVFIRHQLNGGQLRHELWFNGELAEDYNIDLPNPQETAQGLGSAITYLRRYDIVTALGLIADDDDGGEASKPAPTPPRTTTRRAPTKSNKEEEAVAAVIAAFPGTEVDNEF